MADSEDEEQARVVLDNFAATLPLFDPTRTATDRETPAGKAAQTLLEIFDDDVQGLGSFLLDLALEDPWPSELESLTLVVGCLQAQCSSEKFAEFYWAIRDKWNYVDPPDADPDQEEAREDWRVLNAFVARIAEHANHTILLNGLWTLRSALEDQISVEGNLPAAAMWVLHAGKALFNPEETFPPMNGTGTDPARPGKDFHGPSGLTRQRWNFWKHAFEMARSNEDLSEEAQEWAAQAVQAMLHVEIDHE